MKYFTLITILYLFCGPANATFELEDPADPATQLEMEEQQKSIFKSTGKRFDVIVAAGTDMYIPAIEQGACGGWRLDRSAPWQDEKQQTHFGADKTYMGFSMKTIKCSKDAETLGLTLVKTGGGRLFWVATDQLLATD